MHVHEILSSKGINGVLSIKPDASITELLDALAEHNVGALIVSADGAMLEGIVSERDIVRKFRSDPVPEVVRDIMTTNLRVCSPDDSLDDVMGLMTEHRVRHIPVVDGETLVGVLSIGDAVKSRMDQLEFERDQLTHYLHGQ